MNQEGGVPMIINSVIITIILVPGIAFNSQDNLQLSKIPPI